MNIQQLITQNHLELLFQQGTFGIEKSQRIDEKGKIVTTHLIRKFLETVLITLMLDRFAESQLELITPPQQSVKDAYRWLSAIAKWCCDLCRKMNPSSPFSMPLALPPEK